MRKAITPVRRMCRVSPGIEFLRVGVAFIGAIVGGNERMCARLWLLMLADRFSRHYGW